MEYDDRTRTDFEEYEKTVIDAYRKYLNPNYADFLKKTGLAHTVREAKGSIITDSTGKSFIDFIAGYGIYNFGHNPSAVIESMKRTLDSTPLWNRPFLNDSLVHLAERLVAVTSGRLGRVFVCSTGAEAVDSALKLARLSTGREKIVAASGAYHGYTLGALSVCGIEVQRKYFEPLLPGVTLVPFGDSDALERAVDGDTAAVLLEPVQAEIGGETPPDGYLENARKICDKSGTLLIFDEVRTGMGRTGPLFLTDNDSIRPDILVIGKSLASGVVSAGAILAHEKLWGRFRLSFSMSASSFAGNRLACVAATETLKMLEDGNILANGKEAANVLWAGLTDFPKSYPGLVERITGRGMLIGVHFKSAMNAAEVIRLSIADGLLVAAAFCNSSCILIEPPLILEREQAEKGIKILRDACQNVLQRTV